MITNTQSFDKRSLNQEMHFHFICQSVAFCSDQDFGPRNPIYTDLFYATDGDC